MNRDLFEPDVCTECGSENIEFICTVTYKRNDYSTYKCKDCGNVMSNEPDWDSLPGGHDDD